ncbi:MAG: DSD1 family PLP-dependent enzyme [Pirellulaceae bacterium]
MQPSVPPPGATKNDIDTPALCIDLDKFDANIQTMAAKCRQRGIDWRPHSKCHKSPIIARKLMMAGAIGVTCAKLGEAEVMGAAGIRDVLIANLIVGTAKMQRLVALRRIADPVVCVDHVEHVKELGAAMARAGLTLRVLVEVDIGMSRVGVLPGEPTLQLAQQVAQTPGLQLAGLMGYEGHLLLVEDSREKDDRIREAIGRLLATKELLVQHGLPCDIVSCGGTGSYRTTLECPGVTELQAGGAVFMDVFYRERCRVDEFDYALTVLSTVVSRPAPDRAVIDAGRKTMNMELSLPRVLNRSDIEVMNLSAEHGLLRLEPSAQSLAIGDRLEFIPGYGDFTTVLHGRFYAFRGDRLEGVWPLEARGRVD